MSASPSHESESGGERPLSRVRKAWLIFKVVELRLRFIAVLAATALGFAYWDEIWNRVETWRRPPAAIDASNAGATTDDREYYCPMHPKVIQNQPGKCPICAMPLSQRKKGAKAALPAGATARVELTPDRVAQGRVRTVAVNYAPVSETLTTTGTVELDERRLARIALTIKGTARIEALHVNFTGEPVQAGEPLADLYSSELDQAIQELLLAQKSGQMALRDSIARRLRLWGIQESQVRSILRDGKPIDRFPALAPISGVVLRKSVVQGQYVNEGDPLFEVADLSRVWVKAQVHQDQLARVRVGQKVEATVSSYPDETFTGTVAFIDPVLSPATRTIAVRYDLDNPRGLLRPGMFVTVTIHSQDPSAIDPSANLQPISLTAKAQGICPVTGEELGSMGDPIAVQVQGRKVWICCEGCEYAIQKDTAKYMAKLRSRASGQTLTVPETAVIDTGSRKIVYVETTAGVYEGREVKLGRLSGSAYPVLRGLKEGDRVVTSGAFLIDAETRLNPDVASTYIGGAAGASGAGSESGSGATHD